MRKYPNRNLASVFPMLPQKLITIGPMALCDDFVQDLGETSDEEILVAIGLSCLLITTHDDVVDETPKNRVKLTAIGPLCALAITGRDDLQKTINRFATNYGVGFTAG